MNILEALFRIRMRHKVFFLVLAIGVASFLALSLLSEHFLTTRFGAQERKFTQAAFAQSRQWLEGRVQAREALAKDWSIWDENVKQIKTPSDSFRTTNLTPEAIAYTGNQLYLSFDTNGTIIDSLCTSHHGLREPCPLAWIQNLSRLIPLWHTQNIKLTSGIVAIGNRHSAICITQMTPNAKSEQRIGYLAFGEYLSLDQIPIPAGIGRLALRPASDVVISPPGEIELFLSGTKADSIEGIARLPAIYALGSVELWARLPRVVFAESSQGLQYLMRWMVLIGILLACIVMLVLGQSVVKRIERLRKDLIQVGRARRGARVQVQGGDDFGDLCLQVNRTLEELDDAHEEYELQRLFDPVTGLANRNQFLSVLQEQMERAGRLHTSHFAMALVALERFQRICDSLGTDSGDHILRVVTSRLQALEGVEHVSRVSNHEFALILPQMDEIRALTHFSEQLRMEIEAPILIENPEREVHLKLGIGISMASDMQNLSAQEVLRRSESALHNLQSENALRSVALFDPELDRQARERVELERDLRRAVQAKEFLVAFQPIQHIQSGSLAGFEALVRWNHPEKGMIPPLQFIPLAEELGLIEELGEHVLRSSCVQLMEWTEKYPVLAHTFISVNLSPKQFRDPLLISKIWHAVQACGLPFERLKLEITESSIMDDPQECARRLRSISDLGIKLSLDDFGTGYSSFVYLDRFPVHTLKLDKSFVDKLLTDPECPIVKSVTTVAKVMGYEVIAEGVEEAHQAAILAQLGCGYIQGYLYGKPMFPDVLPVWLKTKDLIASARQ